MAGNILKRFLKVYNSSIGYRIAKGILWVGLLTIFVILMIPLTVLLPGPAWFGFMIEIVFVLVFILIVIAIDRLLNGKPK